MWEQYSIFGRIWLLYRYKIAAGVSKPLFSPAEDQGEVGVQFSSQVCMRKRSRCCAIIGGIIGKDVDE